MKNEIEEAIFILSLWRRVHPQCIRVHILARRFSRLSNKIFMLNKRNIVEIYVMARGFDGKKLYKIFFLVWAIEPWVLERAPSGNNGLMRLIYAILSFLSYSFRNLLVTKLIAIASPFPTFSSSSSISPAHCLSGKSKYFTFATFCLVSWLHSGSHPMMASFIEWWNIYQQDFSRNRFKLAAHKAVRIMKNSVSI